MIDTFLEPPHLSPQPYTLSLGHYNMSSFLAVSIQSESNIINQRICTLLPLWRVINKDCLQHGGLHSRRDLTKTRNTLY